MSGLEDLLPSSIEILRRNTNSYAGILPTLFHDLPKKKKTIVPNLQRVGYRATFSLAYAVHDLFKGAKVKVERLKDATWTPSFERLWDDDPPFPPEIKAEWSEEEGEDEEEEDL